MAPLGPPCGMGRDFSGTNNRTYYRSNHGADHRSDNSTHYHSDNDGNYRTYHSTNHYSDHDPDNHPTTSPTTVPTTTPVHTVPVVTAEVSGDTVVMNWQQINDADFLGYKVVVSKNNPNPAYPGDGYMFWITDRTDTTATLDSGNAYNGGDFGGHLVPGETYSFSVTAMYQPYQPVAGNAVRLTFPGGETPDQPVTLPGMSEIPTDPDADGIFEDLNANEPDRFRRCDALLRTDGLDHR